MSQKQDSSVQSPNRMFEDTGCGICGEKPSVLCGLHPLMPAKILERRCKKHFPFKDRDDWENEFDNMTQKKRP